MERCGCFASIAASLCGKESKPRARYSEHDYTIEFENLIEEEDFYEPPQSVVSDVERDLLKKGKFNDLLEHQRQLGEKQEEMLRQQEEDARLEDEAYIQAKKEAAKARKLKQPLDKNALMKLRMNNSVEFSKWLAEEEIDITSPNLDIEDFGSFLEKMRAKNKSAITLDNDDANEHFEQTLKQGVNATKIVGDVMNSLQPVELHAVSTKQNYSSTVNHSQSFSRPFTPDFSSIASNASDLSISTNNTPSKNFDSTQSEDFSSFNGDLSSHDIEATPTNDSTFIVRSENKTPLPMEGASFINTSSEMKPKETVPSSKTNISWDQNKKENEIMNNSKGLNNVAYTNSGSSSFGDFDDDDDFVSADGDFEEMLV